MRFSSRRPDQLAPQQRDVQGRQLRCGVDAEQVGQRFPGAFVREQRLGVASGRGEGPHQRGDQPFPLRMGGHQIGQLRDQLGTVAETHLGLEPILQRGQAQPFEPGARGVQRFAIFQAHIGHGRTTPQGEGIAQQLDPA